MSDWQAWVDQASKEGVNYTWKPTKQKENVIKKVVGKNLLQTFIRIVLNIGRKNNA